MKAENSSYENLFILRIYLSNFVLTRVYKMGKVYKGADTWDRLTGLAKSSARLAGRNVPVHISAKNDLLGNHVQSFECEVYFLLPIKPADFGLRQLTSVTA